VTCLREGTVRLPDGRLLGFGEYGIRGGKPVLLFHGSPGGRQFDQGSPVRAAGAWLFVLERPGVGLSDPKPGRKLLDWPADAAAFADAMSIDRFSVVGFSSGGPYALACGYALPERVAKIGLVCGYLAFPENPDLDDIAPPGNADRLVRYRREPEQVRMELVRENNGQARQWATDPDGFFRSFFGPAAETMQSFWLAVMSSTFGSVPDLDEDLILLQPIGFPVEEVSAPVHAWYGDQDPLLLPAKELLRRRPATALTIYPGEGHMIHPSHRSEWYSVLTDW
jgi:pimeloyl-ACP methyl ester carboxylesterase